MAHTEVLNFILILLLKVMDNAN